MKGSTKIPYHLITFLLFCCALFVVSSVYVATPLAGEISLAFQVSPNMAAWTTSVFSICYGIGFLFFGPLSDKFGRKRMITFGLASLAVVTILIFLVSGFYQLIFLRGIQGFVAATFAPSALAYVFEVFPKQRIATTIGFISFGFVVSGIFGQVASGIFNQTFDWKTVFLFFGILYLISALAVYFVLPNKGETHETNIRTYFLQVRRLFLQMDLLLCYLITITLLLTFIGMYTVLGNYLSSSPYNLTEQEILGIRAMGIVGMILSPIAGGMMKRFGVLPILKTGLLLAAVGLTLIGFSNNVIMVTVMSICFVGGISITFPSIMMLVGEIGGKRRAIASSFYTFILFIGATLGPILSVNLMGWVSFQVTMIILASLLVVALFASFFIKFNQGQTQRS